MRKSEELKPSQAKAEEEDEEDEEESEEEENSRPVDNDKGEVEEETHHDAGMINVLY